MPRDLSADPLEALFGCRRQREPISTFIGLTALIEGAAGGLIAGGGALTIAGLTAGQVGGLLIGTAIIGLNFALSKTKPDKSGLATDPASINSLSARGSLSDASAPQRRIYGRMSVGGLRFFYDDSTPPHQYVGLALARGRISAVRAIKINNQRIVFGSGTPFNTVLDPLEVEGQDYFGNLKACFRQGLSTQTKDTLLDTYFPASGSEIVFDSSGDNVVNLPSTFRQRGVPTATFRAEFGATQDEFQARWGNVNVINPLVEVDGHPLFDPRNPACDIDDESTYVFNYNGRESGRNASLVQANWVTQAYGGRLSTDQIRLDELADAADWDDEIVHDRDGNPRPRHQADGVVSLNDNPRSVTEAMLTANRAWIVNSRGRVGWVSSKPLDPIVTITESDLRGGAAIEYRDSAAKADLVNRVRDRFNPPEKDYVEDDGPIYDRPDLQATDGQLLDTTVTLPFTTDQRGVQWLTQQFLDDSRLGRALELMVAASPRLLKCKIGSIVQVAMQRRYTDINGIYQIRKDGYSADFSTLTWSLREYDKSISSEDRSADQQDFQVATAA